VNADILVGEWKRVRGKIKEHWGKLTDGEFDQIEGRRDQVVGRLQMKYGYARVKAEDEYDKFHLARR
jgi:uncharacterized protein YjbJ (UPF0337 family)